MKKLTDLKVVTKMSRNLLMVLLLVSVGLNFILGIRDLQARQELVETKQCIVDVAQWNVNELQAGRRHSATDALSRYFDCRGI